MTSSFDGMLAVVRGDNLDLTLYRGAQLAKEITLKNPDDSPFDLSIYSSITFSGYDCQGGDVIVNLTTGNGGITKNDGAGTITLLMTAAATAALQFIRSGNYVLKGIGTNDVDILQSGNFIISDA